ncbi:MAG: c-type cytochrome [Deltaproteobacteria bacterium]|nr:c-type cytochrome [Deltaproteobacteria bacterium]
MRWFCTLLFVSGMAGAPGCESGSARPEPTPLRPPVSEVDHSTGKQTYDKYCAPCHGLDLKGYVADHAPSLINQTFLETATDDFLTKSIALGRPGTSMPAYSKKLGGPLADDQIASMVAYIRSNGPPAIALAPVGKGQAERGTALYNEYCKTCHGDTTVRGEAMHLANVQWQRIASDAFIRYAIEKGRPGTKMLGFGTVMKPAQLDDVVAYVRALGTGQTVSSLLPAPTGKEPLVINPKGGDPVWKVRDKKFVPVDEAARELVAGKKMIIIDARPPSDWMRVHIAGAVSIPYHELPKLDAIPKDVAVLAYCACPHHLSGIVVDELAKRGHKKAYVLDEGINLWHQKNYPVVAAPGVTAAPSNHGTGGDHSGHDHSGHNHP